MWKPTEVGEVFAERAFDLEIPGDTPRRVVARLGRPLRSPQGGEFDPWWCPVDILGFSEPYFDAVGGLDSFQAVILALQHLAERVRVRGKREHPNATVRFLGEDEAIILAREFTSSASQAAITALVAGMIRASAILDAADPAIEERTRELRKTLMDAQEPYRNGPIDPLGTGRKEPR